MPGTPSEKGDTLPSMNQDKPRLLASLPRASDNEARHLLLYFLSGSAETSLMKFTHGIETTLGHGTEYEMNQKASGEIQAWVEEGFKIEPGEKVFERLPWTIALGKKLGHTIVHDPRLLQTKKLPLNATGAFRLDQWAACPDKNGGGYPNIPASPESPGPALPRDCQETLRR
jgi:hypothetical protein